MSHSQVETRGRKKKTTNFGKPSKGSETNGMRFHLPLTVGQVCECVPCSLRYGRVTSLLAVHCRNRLQSLRRLRAADCAATNNMVRELISQTPESLLHPSLLNVSRSSRPCLFSLLILFYIYSSPRHRKWPPHLRCLRSRSPSTPPRRPHCRLGTLRPLRQNPRSV